jgi:hypothetical protein
MMIRSLLTVLVLSLSLGVPTLRAQTPAGTAPPTEPSRWRAVVDLLFSGASGNQDLVVLTSGARVTHLEKQRFEMEVSGQARYGRSEGKEVARNLRGGWKLDLSPQALWSPFVFGTVEHDPFRKLNVRASGGGGVKYSIVDRADAQLSISGAGLYSYEDVRVALDSAVDQFRQTGRSSWRVKGSRSFAGGVSLEQVAFYQPRFADVGDYLMTSESSLRAKLTSALSFKALYSFERDSTPPEDVRADDHRFEAGISVQF